MNSKQTEKNVRLATDVVSVNTPNKNVYSNFMKSDVSFYRRLRGSAAECGEIGDIKSLVSIIITPETINITTGENLEDIKCYEHDFGHCSTINYTIAGEGVLNTIEYVRKTIVQTLGKQIWNMRGPRYGVLCFPRMYTRIEIVSFLHIMYTLFDAILVVTEDNCTGIARNRGTSSTVYITSKHMSFVELEDFVPVKTYCINYMIQDGAPVPVEIFRPKFADINDHADYFTKRPNIKEIILFYLCNICNYSNTDREEMHCHVCSKHIRNELCVCGKTAAKENPDEDAAAENDHASLHIYAEREWVEIEPWCSTMSEFIEKTASAMREKNKTSPCLNVVFDGLSSGEIDMFKTIVKQIDVCALKFETNREENTERLMLISTGIKILLNLDISKELWMTDQEWRDYGIRVFKEKVLFYI